jgi:uncharacterized membrane protein
VTFGDRAADRLRNGMGSWTFVLVALAFLTGGMALNGTDGFDPYPFILLNLVWSCLAALQGAILLIAARRSDQIASELARHDYEADTRTRDVVEALAAEVSALRAEQHMLPGVLAQWLGQHGVTSEVCSAVDDGSDCPTVARRYDGSGGFGPDGTGRAAGGGGRPDEAPLNHALGS